jgi:hypothetical protein
MDTLEHGTSVIARLDRAIWRRTVLVQMAGTSLPLRRRGPGHDDRTGG